MSWLIYTHLLWCHCITTIATVISWNQHLATSCMYVRHNSYTCTRKPLPGGILYRPNKDNNITAVMYAYVL